MIYDSLSDVPGASIRTVIINYNTIDHSMLALASADQADMPSIMVLDCYSTDGSYELLSELQRTQSIKFDFLSVPLNNHGITLDTIFEKINSEYILLVDSDIELLDNKLFNQMLECIQNCDQCYGAGILHPGQWMTSSSQGVPERTIWYAERMWIPFTLLRVDIIREALQSGSTFEATKKYPENNSRLVHAGIYNKALRVANMLHKLVSMQHNERKNYPTHAKLIEYDTGAILHKKMIDSGYSYASTSVEMSNSVIHYGGATREARQSMIRRVMIALKLLPSIKLQAGNHDVLNPENRLHTKFPELYKLYLNYTKQ